MLTMCNLGKNGRLGNQMFQYAALKGIAANRNIEYCIPHSNNMNEFHDHQLLHAFKMRNVVVNNHSSKNKYYEQSYFFDEKLFNECPDNTDISGYFQSYKYFDHIKDELLVDFSFKIELQETHDNYVSIHVRRGDYVSKQEYHPVQDESYYCRAMAHFSKDTNFLVFSDDPAWCENQWFFRENPNVNIVIGADNVMSLYLMSRSKANIIANSSFSWWGAYLNKTSEVVIYPREWFGPMLSHQSKRDLIPKEWVQV